MRSATRPRRVHTTVLGIVALLAGATVGFVAPAGAAPATPRITVTFASDVQDAVGRGESAELASDVDSFTGVELSSDDIAFTARHGTDPQGWSFRFGAGDGAPLRAGTYANRRDLGPDRNRIGLARGDISGHGRGCSGNIAFTVVDLATDGERVTRLDLDFVQHCGDALGSALWGELRVGYDIGTDTDVSARTVDYPVTDPLDSTVGYPITLTNTSAVPYRLSATLEGRDGQAFTVVDDGCEGTTLDPGARCTVSVAFRPVRSGTMLARLRIGSGHAVELSGRAPFGQTYLGVDGSAGDFVAGNHRYRFTPGTSGLGLAGGSDSVTVRSFAQGAWRFTLDTDGHGPLRPGTYATRRTPARAGELAMDLDGDGRGCNTSTGQVTIRRYDVDPVDHRLYRADLSYRVRCDTARAATTGDLRIDATDTLPGGIRLDAAPRTAPFGRAVGIAGRTAPNAAVHLTIRAGSHAPSTRTVVADTAGRFRTTARATSDLAYSARADGRTSRATTLIAPTLAGARARTVRTGARTTFHGTGNPDRGVVLRVTTARHTSRHTVRVGRDGRWSLALRIGASCRVRAVTPRTGTSSAEVRLRARKPARR